MIAAFVFVHTAGYDFFAAANSGAYDVPVSPYYNFFASVVSGSPVLSIAMGITFLGFLLPGLYINSSLVQRSLFAWSFDGLLPRRLSSVSARTRTPVLAITTIGILGFACSIYLIYGSNVGQVLAVTGILLAPPVVVAGLAGLLLPRRLPYLYQNGPADWKLGRVPVLKVASAGAVVLGCAWGFGWAYFHSEFGVKGWATMPLILSVCGALGWAWYAIARAAARSRGIELKYVYNTIPPE
jgi:amino acid transporter